MDEGRNEERKGTFDGRKDERIDGMKENIDGMKG